MNYSDRQSRAAELFEREKLDVVVLTHLPNVQYLCGFTGSAAILVFSRGHWRFFTDGRYTEQAAREVHGARVVTAKGPAMAAVAKWLSREQSPVIAFEGEHTTVAQYSAWKRLFAHKPRLRETHGLVEQLRVLKDSHEVELIRNAVDLGCDLLDDALRVLEAGVPETDVAAEIEYGARKGGASGMSFETIVASGVRSALPHGVASNEVVPPKGFVVMDFGVILAHYCSDMTRTVHVGRIPPASRHVYEAVKEAQQAAVEAVRPGVEIGQVDTAARRVLKRAGLAKYFTHSTGHGVGLEIHEMPRIAAGIADVLKPGMVITIEPGAYLPGQGGVRIEDMVLVTDSGHEVLTRAPKDLMVI